MRHRIRPETKCSIRCSLPKAYTARNMGSVSYTHLVYCSIGGNSTICISDDFCRQPSDLIKTIQDSLVETVENNVDEIEYFSGMDEIRTDADIDYLIDYRKGYLHFQFAEYVPTAGVGRHRPGDVFLDGAQQIGRAHV